MRKILVDIYQLVHPEKGLERFWGNGTEEPWKIGRKEANNGLTPNDLGTTKVLSPTGVTNEDKKMQTTWRQIEVGSVSPREPTIFEACSTIHHGRPQKGNGSPGNPFPTRS